MNNIFETLAQATKPETMSTTVKHTPGPWKFYPRYNGELAVVIYSENGATVCDIIGSQHSEGATTKEQAIANAKLIAAAPELLELLQEWYENNMKGIDPSPGSFGGRVFDVLKKSVAI